MAGEWVQGCLFPKGHASAVMAAFANAPPYLGAARAALPVM